MKIKIDLDDELFVRIDFVGDATTPIYRFRLYRRNKFFHDHLWTERIHRDKINTMSESAEWTKEQYDEHQGRLK